MPPQWAASHSPLAFLLFLHCSDDEKLVLLRRCCALVYTPANEHFGICPLEAMYMQKPVVAVRCGRLLPLWGFLFFCSVLPSGI